MNEQAILHIPESRFCFPVGKDRLTLRLRIDRRDTPERIRVVYGGKYEYAETRLYAEMKREYCDRLYAYYTATLTLTDVRLVYVFEITEKGKAVYYSEDGLTGNYDFTLSYYNSFQFAYINAADVHEVIPWMETATFYEIFVDRFDRGDGKKDDSYINLPWGEIPQPKSFAGGDLSGITRRLDGICSLGVNALYLTPIFCSISNHKYDISDYYRIDPQFGTKADFKRLVAEAHRRGMRVVLDAVFNHGSDRSPQFQNVLKKGKKSSYYDWFIIHGDSVTKNPRNYECFGSCDYMPKWNTSNPKVREFLIDVATYWIREFNIDGWRLDVSDEVSHGFWREFRRAVKHVKRDCAIIGENWHDASPYLQGDQYDGIMNYAYTKACLDFFAFDAASAESLADRLNGLLMRNTDPVNAMMMNLLDSHDTHRFYTRVEENEDKLKAALALTYLYPGAPCLYYGTENAMPGGYDPDCRRTMDWVAAPDTELRKLISALSDLKHREVLAKGWVKIRSRGGILVLERSWNGHAVSLQLAGSAGAETAEAGGTVLAANLYHEGRLEPWGFVIQII